MVKEEKGRGVRNKIPVFGDELGRPTPEKLKELGIEEIL